MVRVERAHLTLQDRFVKELRLRGISTVAEANAWAPSFMAAYNTRFAKPPKSDFDAHRPLRSDESLDLLLTWREPRKVTKSLTVQYDRVMYLLDDAPENRKLIDRYIEVWEYPDGRIEIRADGQVLSCRKYDKLAEIDRGTVVEHTGHSLCRATPRRRCQESTSTDSCPMTVTPWYAPQNHAKPCKPWRSCVNSIFSTLRAA